MPNKRIQKALCNLNAYIDGDREILSDRIKLLEKSHKRMLVLIKTGMLIMDSFWDLCESPKKYVVFREGENQAVVARTLEDLAQFSEALRKELKREVL